MIRKSIPGIIHFEEEKLYVLNYFNKFRTLVSMSAGQI